MVEEFLYTRYTSSSENWSKETLYPLCNAAADIVSSNSLKDAQKAIKSFETLYYGELNIIADGEVAEAVKTFSDALLEYKNETENCPPPFDLIAQSGNLGNTCKKVLNLEKDGRFKCGWALRIVAGRKYAGDQFFPGHAR